MSNIPWQTRKCVAHPIGWSCNRQAFATNAQWPYLHVRVSRCEDFGFTDHLRNKNPSTRSLNQQSMIRRQRVFEQLLPQLYPNPRNKLVMNLKKSRKRTMLSPIEKIQTNAQAAHPAAWNIFRQWNWIWVRSLTNMPVPWARNIYQRGCYSHVGKTHWIQLSWKSPTKIAIMIWHLWLQLMRTI